MPPLSLKTVGILVAAVYLAFKVYIWRKYRDLSLRSGLIMVNEESSQYPWGNFLILLRNWDRIYDYKVDLSRKNAPARSVTIPPTFWNYMPLVSTSDPLVVKHILKDKFDIYVKPKLLLLCLHELLGQGLFGVNHGPHSSDQGAHWTLQRKTASKVFTNNNFNSLMFNAFSEHARVVGSVLDAHLTASSGGKSALIELQDIMFQYTLDSIGQVGFGIKINSLLEKSPFSFAFDRAQHLCTMRFLSPYWNLPIVGKLLYSGERELPQHLKVMNDFMFDIIQQKKVKAATAGQESHDDILDLFIQERLGFSDVELRDVVFTFLIAGRDTTACTLTFSLLLLAQYPEWQDVIYQEIQEKRRELNETRDLLPASFLSTVTSLSNVMMECLRLYPPVPTDTKEACEDDVLPGGHAIPKGTRVSFEPYVMGRSPAIWGEDCLEFKPERWSALRVYPNAYEFPVFQAGPRICLGESMAKFETQLMLAFLVERYTFAVPENVDPFSFTYLPGITLKVKDGLRLQVTKRTSL